MGSGKKGNPPVDRAGDNNTLYDNIYSGEVANVVWSYYADGDQGDIKNNLWYLPFHNVANGNRTAVYNTVGATQRHRIKPYDRGAHIAQLCDHSACSLD